MKFVLLTKAEVEQRKFKEKAGMINVYTCPSCRQSIVYLYIDSGETPGMILCHHCGGEAFSQLSGVRQPSRYWYRPKDMEELKAIAKAACEIYADGNEEDVLQDYIIHYNMGGLFARII